MIWNEILCFEFEFWLIDWKAAELNVTNQKLIEINTTDQNTTDKKIDEKKYKVHLKTIDKNVTDQNQMKNKYNWSEGNRSDFGRYKLVYY